MAGKKFWVVLIDEIDAPTSRAAHLALLSRLDATGFPQNTIFFFTSNGTENLEPRLLSRMRRLDFTSYGLAEPASKLLAEIWQREAGNAEAPNFGQIARDARNNIRDCLMRLETEILAA
jgi:DNA polymerase III gamma/tau subunit